MQLAEMGFPLEACRKAVYYTGNMGPEMAFNWIIAHMEEPGETTGFAGSLSASESAENLGLKIYSEPIMKHKGRSLVLLTVAA